MRSLISTKEFIARANKVHNNRYNYSLVEYKGSLAKVKIICPKHGIFEQKPSKHINEKNICPFCSKEKQILSLAIFIQRSNKIYSNKYDYSLVNYATLEDKIKIICPIHGLFIQRAASHLQSTGCKLCGINVRSSKRTLTTKEFITKSKLKHGNKYDYSLVIFTGYKNKVKIICPKHGIFEQTPGNHLQKNYAKGCSKCAISMKSSKGEKEVLNFIKSFYTSKIVVNDRIQIKPKELDIFLPELKIGIEYNGTYWHKLHEERIPGYHKLKNKLCKDKGIKLINISENDWNNNLIKVKKLLSHLLTKSKKIK